MFNSKHRKIRELESLIKYRERAAVDLRNDYWKLTERLGAEQVKNRDIEFLLSSYFNAEANVADPTKKAVKEYRAEIERKLAEKTGHIRNVTEVVW
jgi:hypothetical protein